MSDSAFSGRAFPGYTTAQLRQFISGGHDLTGSMEMEVERREAVAAGDVSRMTQSERLSKLWPVGRNKEGD